MLVARHWRMIFTPFLPRTRGHRHRHVRRVDVAVVGRVQRAQHTVEVIEWMQLGHLLWAHQARC